MTLDTILTALKAERDKLTRAIAALEGTRLPHRSASHRQAAETPQGERRGEAAAVGGEAEVVG